MLRNVRPGHMRKRSTTRTTIVSISVAGIILRERAVSFEISPPFTSHHSHEFSVFPEAIRAKFPVALTRIFQSVDATSIEGDSSYWEKMYEQGGSDSPYSVNDGQDSTSLLPSPTQACEVRVVTFDLDNTLWKTGPTIATANDVLATFLDQEGINCPMRVENVMKEIFRTNPTGYAPLDTKIPQTPVLLTKLRKDAIYSVLNMHNNYSLDSATTLVETAFDVWTKARHESIMRHLANSVTDCLKAIRELTSSQGKPVVIGAITDGNSNPLAIDALSNYFDFCVNAEQVGVSKPDKRMFLMAMRQLASIPILKDLLGSLQLHNIGNEEEALENTMGPWWVHVGDDFVKDVVAAKSLKLRTIWTRELVLSASPESQPMATSIGSGSKSVEDFVKVISEMKVIEMSVGADDYLADAIATEFADSIVDKFHDVSVVLKRWQSEAQGCGGEAQTLFESAGQRTNVCDGSDVQIQSVQQKASNSLDVSAPAVGTKDKVEFKFCVFCGGKLPLPANFCSACGEKQPELI